jgi:hypothetical protein
MAKLALLVAAALTLSMGEADALSRVVKDACMSDYAAYCNGLKVGTTALRSCMKSHRHMLSQTCILALGSSSEVTNEEIRQYKREMHKE